MSQEHSGPTWHDVHVGDRLTELRFPISLKTLMLELAGTRDFAPYHHNAAYTRSRGIRDIFTNTMFYQGLFARFATDWSGPRGKIYSLDLQMRNQLCPGDVAMVTGSVTAKEADTTASRVKLGCQIMNGDSVAAQATVVLALPTGDSDIVRDPVVAEPLPDAPNPEIPAEARRELHRRTSRTSPYPVSEAQIGYFCEMAQDANPRYSGTYTGEAGAIGEITAPPAALMIWCQSKASQDGLDIHHPDVDLADEPAWPEPQIARPFDFRFPGTSEVIVQHVMSHYGAPIRPGDRLTARSGIIDCSPRRDTKLGPGYFVSYEDVMRNQHNEIVGRVVLVGLHYGRSTES